MGILQIGIILFMPLVWIILSKRLGVSKWLSPVVLSYLTGIVLANTSILPLDLHISETFVNLTVIFAIPLLLYATDIMSWLKYAKSSVGSFLACVLSGVIASFLVTYWLGANLEAPWQIAGMLVGVYTGGTPNMNAIGLMLDVKSETLVLMNAADIFCGGIYLVFLTSIAHPIFSKILPAFKGNKWTADAEGMGEVTTPSVDPGRSSANKKILYWPDTLVLIGLTIGIIGVTMGLCYLIFGALDQLAFILLSLTTLSILASLNPKIRKLRGAYGMGEYLLLMFCVAIGMEADFSTILDEGGQVILFTGCVLSLTVIFHLLLSRWFKIDVDTMMITSTAALYGPVFVGQIASTIKNRALIVSGMATGLVGYAIGNYLGLLVAQVLEMLMSG